MKRLTLCLYEFPASLYEINHWAVRFSSMIHDMELFENDSIRVYYIDKHSDLYNEVVFCLPSNKIEIEKLSYLKFKYSFNKIIYFGKLNTEDFENIIRIKNYIISKEKE